MTESLPAALTRDQIVAVLGELGAELDARGLRAEMFVVGGAAMALAYNTRRATRDVDGVFEPKTEVYQAARHVGERFGLPDGWLNDGVKGLLPGPDHGARVVLAVPGLRVSVPRPEYLLALKVQAARVDRDSDDIRALARICNLKTADEVLDTAVGVFGGRATLLPKTQYLIEEMFPAAPAPQDGSPPRRLQSWRNRGSRGDGNSR